VAADVGLAMGMLTLYLLVSNQDDCKDSLTGLLNWQNFRGYLNRLYRKQKPFYAIVVAVPQLKTINTLYGRDYGDMYLREIANELKGTIETPCVYRISGKYFVLLMHAQDEYEKVRQRLHSLLNGVLHAGGEFIPVSAVVCEIADALQLGNTETFTAYMEYMVSHAPASTDTVWLSSDSETLKKFFYHREVEGFLRAAVDGDLFEVYYQPVYLVNDKAHLALEAQSRLRHPTLGILPASDYIEIAERSGLIAQIGQLQFRRVCRFAADHPELQEKVSCIRIPLSPGEVRKAGFSRKILAAIREYDLPFHLFRFEVTLSDTMEYSSSLYETMQELAGYGIGFDLGDFGSGSVSPDMVLRFPFQGIRLNQSLLSGILYDEKKRRFGSGIILVMKNMGYEVTAEGAEHKKELELLASWGADMIQGSCISAPLKQEELLTYLRNFSEIPGRRVFRSRIEEHRRMY
jgi:EAL domain-containing protein (putative c-di-GMP-specific phosphodiesterase class I)/GGDEF domain-containing protein